MKEFGDGFDGVTFSTFSDIVTETCNCLLQNTARWFFIADNLQEFFVLAVLSPESWSKRFITSISGAKIPIS